MDKNLKQLESGCWVKRGEHSGLALFSMDKNCWLSTEQRAIDHNNKKAEIAARRQEVMS